jgi:PAS domain S-box-containing protein
MTRSALGFADKTVAYGVALLAVLAATAFRWLLFSELNAAAPLTIYCAAVMLAAWYGGWGPGLFATTISVLIGVAFFPARAVTASIDDAMAIWIVIFIAVCVLIIALNDATARARQRAEAENAARRQAATALGESESRFRIMANTAPVKVWMAGPDGLRDWFNERWLRFSGRTLMQEAGHGWLDGVHEGDAARRLAAWQEALAGREPFEIEYRLRRADGQYRWLLEHGQPRFAPDGSFAGYVGSAVDVTDRRRQQERLVMLAETSHALTKAGLDLDRVAQAMVERVAETVGGLCVLRLLSADGRRLEPLAHHHRDPPARAQIAGVLGPVPATAGILGRAVQSMEVQWRPHITVQEMMRDAPGRTDLRDYLAATGLSSLIVAPLLADGHVLGTLALMRGRDGPEFTAEDRDLAAALASRAGAAVENARLLRDEHAARAEAESANRLKDEFLATLSHELRTPLNAIVGWTELLRGGQLEPATTARALETIARNARIQTELVNDVLDVSRIISGNFRIRLASVSLPTVLEAALETVRPTAQAKGIQLEATVDPDVSSVAGDASRLQQVAWNILSNAVKFTPAGGRVTVRLVAGHGRVDLLVADTGIGIEASFLPHVFERFRQGDSSTTRAHGGLGLGLAIVRHIVELHGGTVEARSDGRGAGATFIVKLPAMAITAAAPVRPATSVAGPMAATAVPSPAGGSPATAAAPPGANRTPAG